MNWLSTAPWLLSLALLIGGAGAFGWEYSTVKERDATISDMKAQQAKDIATAVQKVAAEKAADKIASDKIVSDLHAAKADIEEKLNAANLALAAVPPPVDPPGCPAAIDRADVTAFIRGLPGD